MLLFLVQGIIIIILLHFFQQSNIEAADIFGIR